VAGKISFQSLINGFTVRNKRDISKWLSYVVDNEGFTLGEVAIVCCSDDYLLEVNRNYLNHDYFTDIITFDYTDNQVVSGDLMISIDRIRDHAKKYEVSDEDELHRVMVHGVLHLCGYKDKRKSDKELMTSKENHYLKKRTF
jgi:rRNA maturation RNase YbeY